MIKISKYGQILGIWELRIGGAELDLKPKQGDNLRFAKMIEEARKKDDQSILLENFKRFMLDMIRRDYPDESDKEKQGMYVEFNLLKLIEEWMITARWTDKEGLKRIKSDASKKVSTPS